MMCGMKLNEKTNPSGKLQDGRNSYVVKLHEKISLSQVSIIHQYLIQIHIPRAKETHQVIDGYRDHRPPLKV